MANILKKMYSPIIIVLCLSIYPVSAELTRTQTIELKSGWNAVYLEVLPSDANPNAVFNGKPVDQVLTYYPADSSVEYIQDPDEVEWKKAGWHRWVQPTSPEAFAKNLYALQANQPYLIHATEDVPLELIGESKFSSQTWHPDSFNFVGFHVDPDSPPTFFQYFNELSAFSDSHIYYLKESHWVRMGKLDQNSIVSGQAYWVYCRGGSNWMGNIDIKPGNEIRFIDPYYETEIELTNRSENPLTVTLTPIPNASGDRMVPLLNITRPLDGSSREYIPISMDGMAFDLEPGTEKIIYLAVNPNGITQNEVSNLLKLSSTSGEQYYIPVIFKK